MEKVPLRELWGHEEYDFSAWLEENIDILSDELGMTLSVLEREGAVGPFSVDLVAEDERGERVIIENQLNPTDHDHLGKVLTYLTNLDAKGAVWIVSHARPEHIRAVAWLNEATGEDTAFYLVRLAAYKIGDSLPAPLFTLIVGPSPESKDIGQRKKEIAGELAERHHLRLAFWTGLIERAKERTPLHAQRAPTKDHWLSAGAGKAGLSYNYKILTHDSAVELYIQTPEQEENKRIFDFLHDRRPDIESAFGAALDWERLDQKRASRVARSLGTDGLRAPQGSWPKIQEQMIDAMMRLELAMRPAIQAYRQQHG